MSTRRARIKAVAALPVRRKNNEANNNARPADTPTSTPSEITVNPPAIVSEPIEQSQVQFSDTEKETPLPAVEQEQTPTIVQITKIQTPPLPGKSTGTPRSKKYVPQIIFSPRKTNSPKNVSSPKHTPKRMDNAKSKAADEQSDTELDWSIQNHQKIIEQTSATHKTNCNKNQGDSLLDGINKVPDYNPPSIPESIEENVIDGIVPLQSTRNIPKPIDLLKSEIISENAEVLFDPIVPLPSPSKVRPKLRPVPRLPHRRNSIQGSASESEDESRRALLHSGIGTPATSRQRLDSHSTQHSLPHREVSRVRNDSVCSAVSQTIQQHQATPASPYKEKLIPKSRRSEVSRRMSALRRKQRARDHVPRETLTMYDLIFYNPTTNPIVPDKDHPAIKESSKQEVTEPAEAKKQEEAEVDPPEEEAEDESLVPQIKLGPNGEIILDEKSLLIKQTESDRQLSTSVVHENQFANSGRGKYTRARRTADWSDAETIRFYRALAAVGTDFTMMAALFPDRTRRDLKVKGSLCSQTVVRPEQGDPPQTGRSLSIILQKFKNWALFKKEERVNGAQVDRALRSQTRWDTLRLQEEFTSERRLAAERAASQQRAAAELRRAERERQLPARRSKSVKAMGLEEQPDMITADNIIAKSMVTKPPKPKRTYVTSQMCNTNNSLLVQIPKTRSEPGSAAVTLVPPIPPQTLAEKPANNDQPSRFTPPAPRITPVLEMPTVPNNIESGSLVVLTVTDPNSPGKKMLQTYISQGGGKLTPVALPPNLLTSVMGYMKKGTPKASVSDASSPQLTSPSSVASQDSRSSVIQINPSPSKRTRHNSYTITQL